MNYIEVIQILVTGILLPVIASGRHVLLVNRVKEILDWRGWRAMLLNLGFSAVFGWVMWFSGVQLFDLSPDPVSIALHIVSWWTTSQAQYDRFRRAEIEETVNKTKKEDARKHPLDSSESKSPTVLRK